MILVLDNYDSFTYNLVQYLEESEEETLIFKNDRITVQEIAELNPRGIVISPGPGRPQDAGISVEIILKLGDKIPVLGVCLGHQAIAYAFGGTVKVNWRIMHGKISKIYHDGKGIYKGLSNPFAATRYHSLIVDKKGLPDDIMVVSSTKEGEVMGIRHRYLPIEGVQFHPESIMTAEGKKIIKNFIDFTYKWEGLKMKSNAGCLV
ncbi:aminodeoxychorismate/anthranilate synthase component II [Thermosyntropha sp.]|uniref:anthranilate synthase component II n=1 Tax=Thermosyntropha sp. TaxID=2740820 RepID=UPI0025E485AF|nr:aminodeoxychorismate/anthranilate synthase component II [Thermosyntropha sp.]MBO8158771.1 aminodeoxychorismate/anthranilate synthase component II [Thermosyntropha sp.]